jgi:hypothetical protein
MPKFKVEAYEEVYYRGEVYAQDKDEAYDLFVESLGEYHPSSYQHNFQVLDVKKVKEKSNA